MQASLDDGGLAFPWLHDLAPLSREEFQYGDPSYILYAVCRPSSSFPIQFNHPPFQIHKTVWRIRQSSHRQVALQFPEGLLM